ncbi:type II secretion system protein [Nitratiruptor tergarcus]|uniref:Prepilin-type N-terminal cleavage/methylation domain-containing protein n=1 Tax=Nitratiruptor tergarcus DSM 16512 TaxID=1069081 RepID=A0A1W1WQS2_9BACT|nr:type II secretion system protein [Nitratiruptor tergarcus]SMC08370.1 prepilin-type N-terminal cleavage/methylation domain-containing protein [Nitratiruptor tergarcus DSM 16512]
MQRSAFTMIEFIFVIVVLGVLAMVALPRYFTVEELAQKNIAKAFTATLTRTVGHSLWSKSLFAGRKGSIKSDNDGDNFLFYGRSLEMYVSIPKYFDKTSVDFSQCVTPGNVAHPFIAKNPNVGGKYNVFCRDGNETDAPKFVVAAKDTYSF